MGGADQIANDMLRKLLLKQVREGSITPRQAELSALTSGIDLLGNGSTSGQSLDPMIEPWWTFAMTIAWIAWRTPDAVRDNWEQYTLSRSRWVRVPYNALARPMSEPIGYELHECRLPSAFDLMALEAFDGLSDADTAAMSKTIRESREDLFREAGRGELKAVGLLEGAHTWPEALKAIEAHEWPYLELCSDDERDVLRLRQDLMRMAYSRVLFSKATVMKQWPKRAASGAAKKFNQRRLEKFFRDIVAASPAKPTMNKAHFLKIAREQYGVSKAPAESIWKEVIEKEAARPWSDGGRRRKNQPKINNPKKK